MQLTVNYRLKTRSRAIITILRLKATNEMCGVYQDPGMTCLGPPNAGQNSQGWITEQLITLCSVISPMMQKEISAKLWGEDLKCRAISPS